MSVKTKLARQAVKTTAKHTAYGAASKVARKPLRSVTLLTIGALAGALVGWLIGRSGGDDAYSDQIAQAPAPTSVVANSNSTEKASETGAVS
jgi:membrane protein YqaA with SNARE-associated domain